MAENLKRLHARLSRDDVEDGKHRIQIFATDEAGQETGSRSGRLLVDRHAPRVRIGRRGRRLIVIVSDGAPNAGSGLRRRSVKVAFGDGRRKAGSSASSVSRRKGKEKGRGRKGSAVRVAHTYASAGAYRLRVKARDRAGNRVSFARKVRVR